MGRKPKEKGKGPSKVRLPKDAISRVKLGQAFAEYDQILTEPGIFVITPAISAAVNSDMSKCFFIGRRGTGKTAVARYLSEIKQNAIQIHPQVLSPLLFPLQPESLADPRQRPFRSLVETFKRVLEDEVILEWINGGLLDLGKLPRLLRTEAKFACELDFDLRVLELLDKICLPLEKEDEVGWLREMGQSKRLGKAMIEVASDRRFHFNILIDRLDDAWDGSDTAVIMLMALMHACIEVETSVACVRPLLFLRENVFDRVRQIDNESTRLETCVASMDWSPELLLEMIERRLSHPFNTKLPLGGPTWDHFFEKTENNVSKAMIFEYCQNRPRDILTYCSFALELAQSKKHETITIQDLVQTRKRFSETRLKDLGDEYGENYPQLSLVLSRFYGLGREFAIPGVEDFIKKLLVDDDIRDHCGSWIYKYTPPEQFVRLMYNIGFFGIKSPRGVLFRPLGPTSTGSPPITPETHVTIHNSYCDALDLRDAVISTLDKDASWQRAGFLSELPGALELGDYTEKLKQLQDNVKTLPEGRDQATEWEDVVGELIKLCFWQWLANVEPRERDVAGCVVRDWIAANRASSGFWNMVFHKYNAAQIIWECKNYSALQADDFQQVAYYLNEQVGRFAIIAFRGEVKKHYYQHIKRIATDKKGLVLLLTNKDLLVFVRQALRGKFSESHIQDNFDRTLRLIS